MISNRFLLIIVLSALPVLVNCTGKYHTFADYPGFDEYYRDRCTQAPKTVTKSDRALLEKYRPRFVLPPGGSYPIDFYRDYIPFTQLRSWPGKKLLAGDVDRDLLLKHRTDRGAYLDFDTERYRSERRDLVRDGKTGTSGGGRKPAVYGRVYREQVPFPDGEGDTEIRSLTFLKYNAVFATSGLPAELSIWPRLLLTITGFNREDWHTLDNFVAAHVVLDEDEVPIAVVLAQHNHHRTYLLGRDIPSPPDGRTTFDIALRSNEIYPASASTVPVRHRVISSSLYLDYLLSGENGPALKGMDLTWGKNAGGVEFDYELLTISPCDPLYTSEMILGPPRPFFGLYLGRDGPPGSDYFNRPELLPMGNMLKFSYLRDGDPEDIETVRKAIDIRAKKIDTGMIMEYGGRKFLKELKEIIKSRNDKDAQKSTGILNPF